ncbi:alkaline phosphatase family protein [bacterium]|nr:alkaline phosphatase family protein [bacterium]
MAERPAKRVLLIGWDAADWKIINPLLDAGEMPALESLVNNGVMGNLATLDPPLSPMMWTSIATGMHADKHGIQGFIEPAPQAQGVRPVMTTSRKVKALWNILMQNGLKTHVVGWWPGHPAEPINGIYISNHYQRAYAPIDKPWHLHPGTIHPKEMESVFDQLRIHPAELTGAHIMPFVPELKKIDQEKEKKIEMLGKIIADAATIHNAATYIMENEPWDFMAVYYDAIDHFCHGFINFHPPKMEFVPNDQYELYQGVVNGGYRFHDMMLARLIELAGPDTTIVLVSDHGFHSDHLRPTGIRKIPAGPADQHRSYGVICMKGRNIQKDERIYGATLLDITPTILSLYGLPTGRDMDGHTLVQAFKKPFVPEMIDSWEKVEGDAGMHPVDLQEDPWAAQEAMQQLIALGYIEKPDKNKQKAITKTTNESRFYLARVYMNKSMFQEALPILEKLYKKNPDEIRFGLQLIRCLLELGAPEASQKILDEIKVLAEKNRKKKEKQTDYTPHLDLLQGRIFLEKNRPMQALESLEKAEKMLSSHPGLYLQIGSVYSKLKFWNKAIDTYQKVLSLDPDNAQAHHGLARAYLRQRRYVEAAEEALEAIGLLYHYPHAHFNLGLALLRIKRFERAAEAFEVCLRMAPDMNRARRLLIHLYEKQLNNSEKAEAHRKMLEDSESA